MDINKYDFFQEILCYEQLIDKTKYTYKNKNSESILINTNGRTLDYIKSNTIDAIICDHPWDDKKAHQGTNQKNLVEEYKDVTFNYNEDDIKEKYRVLKEGAFCVEILPQLSITNIKWMINILNLFIENGFEFQASVDWVKGKILKARITDYSSIEIIESNCEVNEILNNQEIDLFRSNDKYFNGEIYEDIEDDVYEIIQSFKQNQGKKVKDGECIYFFTKGKARNLKVDYKKIKKLLAKYAGERKYIDIYKEVFIEDINCLIDNEFANNIINEEWKYKSIENYDKRYKIFKEKFNLERKNYDLNNEYMISGTDILPARFIIPQINPDEKIHDSEKPVQLYKDIIKFITKKDEVVLDQFSGSGNVGKACMDLDRSSILIEIKEDILKKSNENFMKNN